VFGSQELQAPGPSLVQCQVVILKGRKIGEGAVIFASLNALHFLVENLFETVGGDGICASHFAEDVIQK
jgi:hypothetical protein